MKFNAKGMRLLERFEGRRRKAYQDQKGIWTIGVGHIGPRVVPGLIASDTQIDHWLLQDVAEAVGSVNSNVKVLLNQNQFNALVCWEYNTGGLKGSTLLKVLNKGNYSAAPKQMQRWDKINMDGKYVVDVGLQRRRATEAALFLEPVEIVSTEAKPVTPVVSITDSTHLFGAPVVKQEVIRAEVAVPSKLVPHPVAPPKHVLGTKAGKTQVGSIITGSAGAVGAGLAMIQPVIKVAHSVQTTVGGFSGPMLTGAVVLVTGSVLFSVWSLWHTHKTLEEGQ